MKILKALSLVAFLVVLGYALCYISSDENSIRVKNEWGIAKDNPLRFKI
jgi:hypothetical protein